MADNCTIYSKSRDLLTFGRLVQGLFPVLPLHPIREAGDSMTLFGNNGSLRITAKMFCEGGDDFCRLLLSTCAFIDGLAGVDTAAKARLTSHIEDSELVLGVLAEPGFASDDRYEAAVFVIARELDGLIFNGIEFLDANGNTLLSLAD